MKSHSQANKNIIQRLWSGEVHLNDVFWNYAIIYGLILNLTATVLIPLAFMFNWHAALIVLIFLLPIPYNILITVSVWRSAEKYEDPGHWPDYAKIITLVWFIFWTLI